MAPGGEAVVISRSAAALVLGSALTLGTAYPAAREAGLPLRLSAHVVNLSTFGATGSLGTVEIVVTRWSTEAKRDRLFGAMHDSGMTSLPEMLRNLPSIEVRLDQAGKGEGRMSVAARLTGDGNGQLVVLEEYGSEPMRLQAVKGHSSR
jgi:hypothetical protein